MTHMAGPRLTAATDAATSASVTTTPPLEKVIIGRDAAVGDAGDLSDADRKR